MEDFGPIECATLKLGWFKLSPTKSILGNNPINHNMFYNLGKSLDYDAIRTHCHILGSTWNHGILEVQRKFSPDVSTYVKIMLTLSNYYVQFACGKSQLRPQIVKLFHGFLAEGNNLRNVFIHGKQYLVLWFRKLRDRCRGPRRHEKLQFAKLRKISRHWQRYLFLTRCCTIRNRTS